MLRRTKKEDTKNKVQAKPPVKSQAKAPKAKEQSEIVLVKVPSEFVFWCHDGSVFEDLDQLCEGLEIMSDETFEYHCNDEKNDFANWIRDIIRDEELAEELTKAENKAQAARSVGARLATLR